MSLRYFDPAEFVMDGANVYDRMDPAFLRAIDECRHQAGVPFKVTSSFRTAEKNRSVGGAKRSMHLYGRAVDVEAADGATRARIVRSALSLGLTVGVMENAVHIDNRDGQILFHYYANKKKKGNENQKWG